MFLFTIAYNLQFGNQKNSFLLKLERKKAKVAGKVQNATKRSQELIKKPGTIQTLKAGKEGESLEKNERNKMTEVLLR
ncbi:MAG: hypothetical protein IJ375_02240 [Oscillospiraceae bacterium]|nr:hypothetical protein [Oscillospiraceae bacterium]